MRNHQLAARNRRNRHTLEGVISSSPMGVIVSDTQGRLSIANAAASEVLAVDLAPYVGERLSSLIDNLIKWRFVNPDEYAERIHAIHADTSHRVAHEAETVDGRVIEHSSSPVRDSTGAVVGRVIMLHDVTTARTALLDARRLAAERAALLEREERRAQEEVALTRAAHAMASALTPADIHERLLEESMAMLPAVRAGRRADGGPPRHRAARGDPRVLGLLDRPHDLPQRRRRGGTGGRRRAAVHLQRHRDGRAHLHAHHPGRRGSSRSCTCR